MQNNYNEWARYVNSVVRQNETAHEVNDEKNNRRFYCYADGPYHAAHLYFCKFGAYPYGATITNKVNGKKIKLR